MSQFSDIVNNIRNNNAKSHVHHNDPKYQNKYELMRKQYFNILLTPLTMNVLSQYANGGYGIVNAPVVQQYATLTKLNNKNNATNVNT